MQWITQDESGEVIEVYDDGQPFIGEDIIVLTQEHYNILRQVFTNPTQEQRRLYVRAPKDLTLFGTAANNWIRYAQ